MIEPLDSLRALLSAIVPGNAFYRARLAAANLSAQNLHSLADFTSRVPFTSKWELVEDQAQNPPYGTNLTYPAERYSRFCQTTGTSGRPLIWLDTTESWQWLLGNWACIYRAAGISAGDRIYFAFSFGPFLGFWTAFEAATQLGCLCLPGGGLGTEARLRALIQHQAGVLLCTPTYALHLAETARNRGIDLTQAAIRKIIVAGEPGGSLPHVRDRISREWNGARVIDHYGMTEVGPVAFEDPNFPGLQRVISSSYFTEVIDLESGTQVEPGKIGELVLTPLGRFGTPLLRYRTGDLVKLFVDEQGIGFEGGIIGRADDMIVVRGVNIYPSAVEAVVRSLENIDEYRVNVTRRGAMSELDLQIESRDDCASLLLERALTDAFTLRIPVTRVEPGTLPRFELKAKRWLHHG